MFLSSAQRIKATVIRDSIRLIHLWHKGIQCFAHRRVTDTKPRSRERHGLSIVPGMTV
jgi:hypothetical protein